MAPVVEEISALPKLRLQKPSRSCREELERPEFLECVTGMAELLEDVGFKVQQLKFEVRVKALVKGRTDCAEF